MSWRPAVLLLTLIHAPTTLAQFEVASRTPALIPAPQTIELDDGTFTASSSLRVKFENVPRQDQDNAIHALNSLLPTQIQSTQPTVTIQRTASIPTEGYRLKVDTNGITISSADAAGTFYAVQTLRQLDQKRGPGLQLPLVQIEDHPQYKVRGFMHDVGRNFQTIESLKDQLEVFAQYKLNTFHWHLSDNPGWRVESLKHSILNDPDHHTRDHGLFYTYAEIRDLIEYARDRHIQVIPELDMPGHSRYFNRAFGFGMADPKGIVVLKDLIQEFCEQIPAGLAPYLHIGSDEINIADPKGFMDTILTEVHRHNRTPIVWAPGLEGDDRTIRQAWYADHNSNLAQQNSVKYIDSSSGYLNNLDPLKAVQRHFFHQVAGRNQSDDTALGSILCCWPDVRVQDKRNIFRHSPVWSTLLAFAESTWHGTPKSFDAHKDIMPAPESAGASAFREFESRLLAHRDGPLKTRPFPYVSATTIPWTLSQPVKDPSNVPPETTTAYGGTVDLSHFYTVKAEEDPWWVVAKTRIFSSQEKTIRAWIGFDSPARSNRQATGIPQLGQWTSFGAKVTVNGYAVAPPKWKEPGAHQYLRPTWHQPANEVPYTDEQFYWTREPALVSLNPRWNDIEIAVPLTYPGQRWTFTFVPVQWDQENSRWVEDNSVSFGE